MLGRGGGATLVVLLVTRVYASESVLELAYELRVPRIELCETFCLSEELLFCMCPSCFRAVIELAVSVVTVAASESVTDRLLGIVGPWGTCRCRWRRRLMHGVQLGFCIA